MKVDPAKAEKVKLVINEPEKAEAVEVELAMDEVVKDAVVVENVLPTKAYVNHQPLDFSHPTVEQYSGNRENAPTSFINKINASWDGSRLHDFDTTSTYNTTNASKLTRLLYLKFSSSASPPYSLEALTTIPTIDSICTLLQPLDKTYHVCKDSLTSCILNFEDVQHMESEEDAQTELARITKVIKELGGPACFEICNY